LRAVIDEGVPRRTVAMLRDLGHDVSDFPNAWKGLKNGRLLKRVVDAGFDVLLTCDRNLHFQQNISHSDVALIVLPAQRFDDLVPFAAAISKALGRAVRGEALVVGRNLEESP
jgi:hypothetical protein